MPDANRLVVDTGTPPIPAARGWLARYDGQHGPVLNLSQAAPGMPPPDDLLERLGTAARDPAAATYGPILGEDVLRAAFAAETATMYGTPVGADDIVITTGCNQAFVVALLAVAQAGDAVLLPEPWYFNHHMMLGMLGIRAVPLPCRAEDGFVPDVAAARDILRRTPVRAMVLVTPNNPTGAIYPAATIAAFARLAAEADCWLVLDETYRDFLDVAGAMPHQVLSDAALAARTLQLYSFSKSYAVPGHRVGAMRVPQALVAEVAKIQDCLQICPPRAAQMALGWAVPALRGWREANRAEIVSRAAAFRDELAGSNGWAIRSIGSYFAYVAHPFAGIAAMDVARRLAEETGVLALPGTFFGGPGQAPYLRFAFANADAAALAGLKGRLARLGPMAKAPLAPAS